MKKLLLGLATVLIINSSYAFAPNSKEADELIDIMTPYCMENIIETLGIEAIQVSKEFCYCFASNYAYEVTMEDVVLSEKNDPKTEAKLDKLMNDLIEKCLKIFD